MFHSCQHDIISYIGSRDDNIDDNCSGNNSSSETDNDWDSSESEDDDFNDDMFDSDLDLDDHIRTHDNIDAILTHDNLDNFLTHEVPTEGMLDRPEEVHVDEICNFMPTTYAVDVVFEVEEETAYGLNSHVVIF